MKTTYVDELEEVFIEKYFEMGDDDDTKKHNLDVVNQLISEYRPRVQEIVEHLEDGEVFDMSDAVLSMQIYYFAVKWNNILGK